MALFKYLYVHHAASHVYIYKIKIKKERKKINKNKKFKKYKAGVNLIEDFFVFFVCFFKSFNLVKV